MLPYCKLNTCHAYKLHKLHHFGVNRTKIPICSTRKWIMKILFHCLCGKLWYLQHNCVGDTIVYHLDMDLWNFVNFIQGSISLTIFYHNSNLKKNRIVVIGLPAITKPSSCCVMYKTFYSEWSLPGYICTQLVEHLIPGTINTKFLEAKVILIPSNSARGQRVN